MKKVVCAIAMLALVLTAGSVFAQGPFTDVATDHWAYQAVDQLVRDGVIVGYPDGTFGGKRAMTRFEFAQALARAIPVIVDQAVAKVPAPPPPGVSQADFEALKGRVGALEAKKPEVTKADIDALNKLANEFKDELTAMGVDLDALKRDLAAIDKRLCAVEKEIERVKWSATATVWALGDDIDDDAGLNIDRDNRTLNDDDNLLEGITFVKEIDLQVKAKVGEDALIVASLNAGNYLNYLTSVADFTGGTRPSNWRDYDDNFNGDSIADSVFPYWLYAQAPFAGGQITVGRQPMQWTPYTLKMPDVDSYTDNAKTDSGDFPLDGIKGVWNFGGVGLQLFAAKADQNQYLGVSDGFDVYDESGLGSQIDGGLYRLLGVFNEAGGYAMGGLENTDQLAGARIRVAVPHGTLGASYIEAGGESVTGDYRDSRLWGADLAMQLGGFMLAADYTEVDTEGVGAIDDISDDNTALDASLGYDFGSFNLVGGYKKIESNFTAPGAWDRFGRWQNPTDIEGEYAKLTVPFSSNLGLVAVGEWLSGIDDDGANLTEDDDITYYNAGLKWGFTSCANLLFNWESTTYDSALAGNFEETFWTIGLGYQFNPAASMKLTYQIVDYDSDAVIDEDSRSNIAVAQFMVKF